MKIIIAYIGVVLIWATTPLTIHWSSDSVSFIAAALLRMSFAFAVGFAINLLLRRKLFHAPRVWQVYAAGALSIFPNMPVVYWSAQYIPSGMVAVVFAMTPFVTGLMTIIFLKENPFNTRRIFALLLAVLGLIIIFYQQFTLSVYAVLGSLGILFSCVMFALTSVLVKKMPVQADAFNQTLGSLLFSLPGLVITWWLLDGHIPQVISSKSFWSIGYLSMCGSLLGITLFFYVLANMTATAVSLITFMTPILALLLGAYFANEILSGTLWVGTLCVLTALLLYIDFSSVWMLKALQRKAWQQNSLQDIKNSYQRFK